MPLNVFFWLFLARFYLINWRTYMKFCKQAYGYVIQLYSSITLFRLFDPLSFTSQIRHLSYIVGDYLVKPFSII